MSTFKVGDQVIIMPSGERGYIKSIDPNSTYPIEVCYVESPNVREGSYLLNGNRYVTTSNYDSSYSRYCIVLDITKIDTITPVESKNRYWSIINSNASFMHLSHSAGDVEIIPISKINSLYYKKGNIILETTERTYDLGPIPFEQVVNMLLPKQQINSI